MALFGFCFPYCLEGLKGNQKLGVWLGEFPFFDGCGLDELCHGAYVYGMLKPEVSWPIEPTLLLYTLSFPHNPHAEKTWKQEETSMAPEQAKLLTKFSSHNPYSQPTDFLFIYHAFQSKDLSNLNFAAENFLHSPSYPNHTFLELRYYDVCSFNHR